jgi:hypothetical protein
MAAPEAGFAEDIRQDTVTVGATSVQISNAKTRKELILTNTGATIISLGVGRQAVLYAGITLYPSIPYFASQSEGFNPFRDELYAIGSAGGGSLAVFER